MSRSAASACDSRAVSPHEVRSLVQDVETALTPVGARRLGSQVVPRGPLRAVRTYRWRGAGLDHERVGPVVHLEVEPAFGRDQ